MLLCTASFSPKLPHEQGVISKVHLLVQLTEASEPFAWEFGIYIDTSPSKIDSWENSLGTVSASYLDLKPRF